MKLEEKDLWLRVTDQRVGMGISGWHMRYELLHIPTKCMIAYESNGGGSWKLREKARQLMELLIEDYEE
jgi:hypothetical protein